MKLFPTAGLLLVLLAISPRSRASDASHFGSLSTAACQIQEVAIKKIWRERGFNQVVVERPMLDPFFEEARPNDSEDKARNDRKGSGISKDDPKFAQYQQLQEEMRKFRAARTPEQVETEWNEAQSQLVSAFGRFAPEVPGSLVRDFVLINDGGQGDSRCAWATVQATPRMPAESDSNGEEPTITMSRVAIDPPRGLALVYTAYQWDPMAGEGYYVVLVNEASGWRVARSFKGYVS